MVTRVQAEFVPQEKVLIQDGQGLETKSLRSEIQVESMRTQLEVLPVGGEELLDLEEKNGSVSR